MVFVTVETVNNVAVHGWSSIHRSKSRLFTSTTRRSNTPRAMVMDTLTTTNPRSPVAQRRVGGRGAGEGAIERTTYGR
jgi:hypothetical protein